MAQTLKQLSKEFKIKEDLEYEQLRRSHEGIQECGSETFRCRNCGRKLKKMNGRRQGESVYFCPKCDEDSVREW